MIAIRQLIIIFIFTYFLIMYYDQCNYIVMIINIFTSLIFNNLIISPSTVITVSAL